MPGFSVRPAAAQPFFPRGDATCSLSFSAADVVAEIRALGGAASTCGNDDCDRDGMVSAADISCAANCLFDRCRVPANAPLVTDVTPQLTAAIVPLSVVHVTGTNFGSSERLKRVTIGGISAQVVGPVDNDTLEVIVPLDVPPGTAEVIVFDGDRPGVASTITVEPSAPIGEPDTMDGTLALLDTAAVLLMALDLESVYDPAEAARLRERLQRFRADLSEERHAAATDPEFTAEMRARLDAGFDGSGLPDQVRALIADIETLLGAPPAVAAVVNPTVPVILSRFAATAALAAAEVAAPIAATAATAATGAVSIPLAPLIAIGTVLAAGGAYTLGLNSNDPVISRIRYEDGNGQRRALPVPGGIVRISGEGFSPFPNLMIKTAHGMFTAERLDNTDTTLNARLPVEPGFCGAADLYVAKSFGVRSEFRFTNLQPILNEIAPEMVGPAAELRIDARGVLPCEASITYTGPLTRSFEVDSRESRIDEIVPLLPPGGYTVGLKVDAVSTAENLPLEVKNPITGLTITCLATQLAVPPGTPSATTCTVKVLPQGEQPPLDSLFVWKSNSSSVSVTNTSTDSVKSGTTTATGKKIGTANIHVALMYKSQMLAQSAMDATIKVDDKSPPVISIASESPAMVRPGASIPVTATVTDNVGLGPVTFTATGDAVTNPSSETNECLLEKMCRPSYTVTLKDKDFMQRTVTVKAEAIDGGTNRTTSNELTFMIGGDSACPSVAIQSPTGSVNAGDSTQASILVTDNGPDDTGVKRVVVDISGAALAAPVHSDITLPEALPQATRLVPFTVKSSADLANVQDRTIVISAQAFDAAMPPNGCDAQTASLAVIGVLDHCSGAIDAVPRSGCIGTRFTVSVTITGADADKVARVFSVNPGGTFDLTPRGGGLYQVTLEYQGTGSFTLTFYATDADGNDLCSGSIGLASTGSCAQTNAGAADESDGPAGGVAVRQ